MNWLTNNQDLIRQYTLNHAKLAIIPILVSFVLAVPLGWIANRNRVLHSVVITGGSLLYTIPSLPLFVILPLIIPTGVLSNINLVVALCIYGVALMSRSATDALASVDDRVLESASAVGYSPVARFFRVQLPLAGPVLLAGIRVVSVSTIALVSVGVIIGSQNLGYFFQDGKQRDILSEVVTGIVLSLLMALVFDLVILLLGRVLMPWNRGDGSSRGRTSTKVSLSGIDANTPSAAVTSGAGV